MKISINNLIENATENAKNIIIENVEIADQLVYYRHYIMKQLVEINDLERDFSTAEIDVLLDYIYFNEEDFVKIERGVHHTSYEFCIWNNNEFSVAIPKEIAGHLTEKRVEAINRHTDLYISQHWAEKYRAAVDNGSEDEVLFGTILDPMMLILDLSGDWWIDALADTILDCC